MSFLSTITAAVAGWVAAVIESLGYLGLLVLMAFESMVIPLPSELVMPFAGFLAAQGTFNFWLVILVTSVGSLLGSLLSYWMGAAGIEPLLEKHGKYILVEKRDLERTKRWFKKRGEITIFIARFIPVVRHLISIPAGMAKMDLKKFCLYTVLGATLWNGFLAYLGYVLGKNWDLVRHYTEPISLTVVLLLVIVVIFFVYRHLKK